MARFTVADCMEQIDNRFDMTLVAALRARQLEKGVATHLEDKESDKSTVLALREIAAGMVGMHILAKVE